MSRKEFLEIIWRKCVKPLVLLTLLASSVQFFVNVFKEEGSERVIILFLLGIAIFFLLVLMASLAIGGIFLSLGKVIPPSGRFWIKMAFKFASYMIPIFTGALAYHFWVSGYKVPVILLGILIIEQFSRMIKQERTKYNNT
ncbi:hypothetical protein [Sabulibacter ruber]|uniref:hypothetical protein n=1 Tax=Sabulibacter ruber TaxID=2811901 RepID=UPI001A97205F|nr:hypothetical protein [Sabulibacter ruber]